ncbi:metallophosphoesterase [Dactylosporangium aurantiacum]|uniref:Metallophosphoesterase n=1 Tax=Dactylosporangium aurantiacum TaxID=35754 RepID=A0A9Q9IFX4_9ACTN|nr:metallophosphoesterase [Dactylosporangium aurantiacum]MDG6108342.1 metallophosphoesterase [Dactylosporangium aurantiacum]UWZ53883.1 metallophosphoesterase [Dactylosporangium aurantiacum]
MTLIAHVSDTHLADDGGHSTGRVDRVVRYLRGLRRPVDAVLVTGDVADHGLPAEYAAAKALAEVGVPLLQLPGNHDERSAFRQALLGVAPDGGPVDQVARVGDLVFALCDSSIPGRADGLLAPATLTWLDGVLAEGAPTFVCFHHPPVPIGHPEADRMRQFGEERLAEVLGRHPNVVALLCGHIHSATVSTFAGVPLLAAPGVASTLVLPWEDDGGLDRDAPPALAFHLFEDGRLTTHYRLVP